MFAIGMNYIIQKNLFIGLHVCMLNCIIPVCYAIIYVISKSMSSYSYVVEIYMYMMFKISILEKSTAPDTPNLCQ